MVAAIFILGLIFAYLPTQSRISNKGISPEEAVILRQHYTGPHQPVYYIRWRNAFSCGDGSLIVLHLQKKDITVLIFHGFTAYSGAYNMAGEPISAGGYTTFGLDYRGHGLSGGNRGDAPGKERWIADLAESVEYIKSLGFSKVIILGHSLGVASAICATNAIPNEISGLVLLSGAYEGRKGLSKPLTLFQKIRILASAICRPSYQSVEYYRDGMTVSPDTLFNFRYTPRYLTMLDVKKLRLPKDLNVPVLVGVGDKDELFEIDRVKEFYNLIPGTKKEFFIMKNATHAKIPVENWQEIVAWFNNTY